MTDSRIKLGKKILIEAMRSAELSKEQNDVILKAFHILGGIKNKER